MQIARQRLRLYAIAGAAATTFVATPPGADAFGMMKLITLLLFAIVCAVFMTPLWRSAWRESRPALLAAASFVLALFMVLFIDGGNYFQSVYGVFGRANGLLGYLSFTVLLLAIVLGFARDTAPSLLTALMGTGAAMGVYCTVQTLGRDPIDWQRSYENPLIGTFGNPDFAAAFLGLAALAATAVLLDRTRSLRLRATAVVVAPWLLWLAWRTGTIQGVLAFAAGICVMLAVWLASPGRASRLRALRIAYYGLLCLGGIAFALGIANRGPLASRLFDSSVEQRLYTWQAALNMFRLRPLTGVGLEAYGDWYPTLRTPASIRVFGQGMFSNEGHSVLLTLLGTGGLLLVAPYLALWLLVGRRAWRLSRQGGGWAAAGIIGIWAAYLFDSLFSMDQLGVAVWGWMFAGAVLAFSKEQCPEPVVPAPAFRALRGGLLALAVAGALCVGLYPLWLDSRISQAEAMPVTDATSRASAVTALLDLADATPEPLRLLSISDRLQAIGAGEQALALAQRSATRFPGAISLWQWIATYQERSGPSALAVNAREHLSLLDPLDSVNARLLALDKTAAPPA